MTRPSSSWMADEKYKAELLSKVVDLPRVKYLVEQLPFKVKTQPEHLARFDYSDALTWEDKGFLSMMYPSLRAMVVVVYLQEALRDEDNLNFDLTSNSPFDIVAAAYNLSLTKILIRDLIESDKIYDIIAPMFGESDSAQKAFWDHFDGAIVDTLEFAELTAIIKRFYTEHGADVYKEKSVEQMRYELRGH